VDFVRSYAQKWQAEKRVKGVAGVAGVGDDLEVKLPIFNQRPGSEIARGAVAAIHRQLPYAGDHIRVVVCDGWVTLEGSVDWNYQREHAVGAVRHIRGVKGVSNLIQLQPRSSPIRIKRTIEEALKRSAELDVNRVAVESDSAVVVLKGTVRSWV
jgi:osmotically-inducible protein OsmY